MGTVSPKATVAKKNSSPKAKIATKNSLAITVKPAEDRILKTMGQLYHIGIEQPKKDQVQSFSGNAKTKAGYEKNLGNLRKKGLVEFPTKGLVALTDKGLEYVGDVDPSSLSIEEFHNNVKVMFSPKAGKIFDAIVDGKVHDKMEVAIRLGYDLNKLSGYEKDLGKMSTLGFLQRIGKQIQLTDKCFPLGRPNK